MESNKSNLSYLVVNLLISDEDLVQKFAGMFSAVLIDEAKDASFIYYAVQNHDADEIITWLEENFGSSIWSVNKTQANKETKDEPEVTLLKKSDKYDEFINENQIEPAPDSVPKSKEQLERESKLKATAEEANDDFEGEIPIEESGTSDDLDDIEYTEEVNKYVDNADIESGRMLEESDEEVDIEDDEEVDIEDDEEVDIEDDEEADIEDDDDLGYEDDDLDYDEDDLDYEEDDLDYEEDDDLGYEDDDLDYDEDDLDYEEDDLDYAEDDDLDYDEDDLDYEEDDLDYAEDDSTFLSKEDQYQTYIKFLNNDIDLLNNSSEELYNKMIQLNKPYSNDEDLRQYLQLAFDMAVLNQQSAISKPNIENLTKNLKNYKDYAKSQEIDTKQLQNKLNSLDIVFDKWLSDRPARFLEFYDYLNESNNDNSKLLNDIQTLLNNSRNRVDTYSSLLADDLDNIDPNILKRQQFNGILGRSYEASKNLYASSRQEILNTTATEAQEVINEQLAEIRAENSRLQEELNNIKSQPQAINDSLDSESDNIENDNTNNDSIGKEDSVDSQVTQDNGDIGAINLTGGDEADDEIDDSKESNDNFLSDDSEISEEDDDTLVDLDLDDDEYEDDEDSLIDKFKLMPIWKKAAAGGLALLLALGLGFGAKKLIFGGGDKNQEQVEQGVDDEDYRRQRAMAFIKDNFKVGDELLLNVDGNQETYTVADYPEDGSIGLILKDSNDKAITLDEATLIDYVNSDQALKEKQKEFYDKYDAEHKNVSPTSNTQPVQDEDLSVDFGNADNNEESNTDEPENEEDESNVESNEEESNESEDESEDNSNEEESNANEESSIKRDNITIEILNKK